MRQVIAYVGVGTNVGDGVRNCQEAIRRIARLPRTRVVVTSSFYRTSPVGFTDQEDFTNAVCEIATSLTPRQLLIALKEIEQEMGRRPAARWGPRLIDLDILLYDHEVIDEDGLQIPHPELHRRRFVLTPFREIAPYVLHPLYGVTIQGLEARLADTGERVTKLDEA